MNEKYKKKQSFHSAHVHFNEKIDFKFKILTINISPNVGLEPTTLRLRVSCSTDWASQAYVLITLLIILVNSLFEWIQFQIISLEFNEH